MAGSTGLSGPVQSLPAKADQGKCYIVSQATHLLDKESSWEFGQDRLGSCLARDVKDTNRNMSVI